jgi:hypothetical protein
MSMSNTETTASTTAITKTFTTFKKDGSSVKVVLHCLPYGEVKAQDREIATAALAASNLAEVWGAEAGSVEVMLREVVNPTTAAPRPPIYEGVEVGVKRHLKSGELYAEGFVLSETEITPPPSPPKVKNRTTPPTLRERVVDYYRLPSGRWRMYKLS